MKFAKEKSVAFTGYRESKMLKSSSRQPILKALFGESKQAKLNKIADATYQAIEGLYKQGFRYYYSGVSSGFDMIAALAVLELRNKYSDVKLIAVVPFVGQDDRYTPQDKFTYKQILEQADEVVIMSDRYIENAQYLKRNDYMLEHSSQLVCYYDGQRGGSMYTYNRAVKYGYDIINICDNKSL